MVEIPVTIGTVPHKDSFERFTAASINEDAHHILPEDVRAKYPGIPDGKMGMDKKGMKFVYF